MADTYECPVEVNMDYPARVATKLQFASCWRVAGKSQVKRVPPVSSYIRGSPRGPIVAR